MTGLCCCLLLAKQEATAQPCFPEQAITAAYATGGNSEYKERVLWLTWGSTTTDVEDYPYGRHDRPLGNGSGSYASIDVGGGRYLCVEAVISNLTGDIRSYAPGDYDGDSMDDLYNINGTGDDNDLVNGIQNAIDGDEVGFTITCKATLDGNPVRLAGLVIGDAESLDPDERFSAVADGTWNIVELQQNLDVNGDYDVLKTNETGPSTRQRIEFLRGNNQNTAAVSFLAFNESAYSASNHEVSFDVTLKGTGLTAIALGLLTINADRGDAPESYGDPLHLFEGIVFTDDNIPVGVEVNLNDEDYVPGSMQMASSNYLGTAGPDADITTQYSDNALGDDDNPAFTDEEDAWPTIHQRWSYNATYRPGNILQIEIPYNGLTHAYVAGWIDFNRNGEFEASERAQVVAPASSNGVATLQWTIPQDRIAKSTYVRLRYAVNEDEILSPTSVATGGEVEDHFIYILGPAITNPMLPSKARGPKRL